MSTNKTENLNLHSWVKTDPFKMEEVNENFTALDANAGLSWERLTALGAAVAALQSGQLRFVTGSYAGNGDSAGHSVSLGFRPKLLLLAGYYPSMSRGTQPQLVLFFDEVSVYVSGDGYFDMNTNMVRLTDDGFHANNTYHNVSGYHEWYAALY